MKGLEEIRLAVTPHAADWLKILNTIEGGPDEVHGIGSTILPIPERLVGGGI